MNKLLLFLGIGLVFAFFTSGGKAARAPDAAGLTGIVGSDAEGPMEGVLVSAKGIPGTITTTLVSDAQGRYTFPPGRLLPGKYRLAIRGVGYEAADAEMSATLGTKRTKANIKLLKAHDLASQLSDVEWLMSIPATYEQKEYLFVTRSHCPTLSPIMQCTYDKTG